MARDEVHHVRVSVHIDTDGRFSCPLAQPTWTPNAYTIAHINSFKARRGRMAVARLVFLKWFLDGLLARGSRAS